MVVNILITVLVLRQEFVSNFVLYLRKSTHNILEYRLFNRTLADSFSRSFHSYVDFFWFFFFPFSWRFRQP